MLNHIAVVVCAVAVATATVAGNREHVVKVFGELSGTVHEDILRHGVAVTGYLGNGRLLVHGSAEAIESLRSYEKIASVEERRVHDKISKMSDGVKSRLGRRLEDEGCGDKDKEEVTINLVRIERSDENCNEIAGKVRKIVEGSGVEVVSHNRLRLTMPSCSREAAGIAMLRLAGLAEVSNVGLAEEFHLLNNGGRELTRGGTLHDSSLSNLSGAGEMVGVADTGLDHDMCFFRDDNEEVAIGSGTTANFQHRKIVQYNPFADDVEFEAAGHGTHVCGSIAGDSLDGTNAEYNGMAPNATLAFLDMGEGDASGLSVPSDIYNDFFMDPYVLGARLHSDSWGSSSAAYTSTARDFDEFMYDHPDFLVLVAAGNDGDSGDSTIGSPATNKNGLAVGASGNIGGGWRSEDQTLSYQEQLVYFSSLGPTDDGRLKPDVLAPGDVVTSAYSDGYIGGNNCGVGGMSGTSMSTPITAGTAALVREYYSEGYYPSGSPNPADAMSPSAALVKATLIHSGQPVYGLRPAPSVAQGFGRVNLENVLIGADTQGAFKLHVEDSAYSLATSNITQQCFQVEDTQDFKATLVWTDAPGEVDTDHALVNDLTLAVVSETDGGTKTTPGNHRYNQRGAEMTVDGVGIQFGYTTIGAKLDITPPLTAEFVVGDASSPLPASSATGKVFVHDAGLDSASVLDIAVNAQNSGAVALVFVTSSYVELTREDDTASLISIPVVTTADNGTFTAGDVMLGVWETSTVDSINNVEQVRLRTSGLVSVNVLADEVATIEGQAYALVITGDFVESVECPVVPGGCLLCVNGDCVNGVCECHDNWSGASCGVEICPNSCSGNGVCTASGCVCDEGYTESDCSRSHCGGEVTLTGSSGTITHDTMGGPYDNNAYCVWWITPEVPNANVRFSWADGGIDLEEDWDYLYFIDGVDAYSPTFTSLTGYDLRAGNLSSYSPAAALAFISDASVTSNGFTIQWEALTCLDDCSGAGTCPPEPESDGTCDCDPGSSGPGCGLPTCTAGSCLNGGVCTDAGVCQCPADWFGDSCEWSGQCSGLALLTDQAGVFTDGSGNGAYTDYTSCGFYVEPAGGADYIEFTLEEFSLEADWDYVFVYDDLQQTNLLLMLTGDYEPGTTTRVNSTSLYFSFITDWSTHQDGFTIAYTAGWGGPPVFSQPSYEFTFIGGLSIVGQVVGSVAASDPAGGNVMYELENFLANYDIDPNTGAITATKKQKKGFTYTVTAKACSDTSGLCGTVDVIMVVLKSNGCLRDGTCPDTGPVFSAPQYSFLFVGGKSVVGKVVGNVEAVDTVYPGAVVTYTEVSYRKFYDMQSNGDILCVKKQKKKFVYTLLVRACSTSGCTVTEVELVITNEKGCLQDGTCPGIVFLP